VPVIGLAYELQLVEQVPTTDRDMPVDKIITESEVIDCRAGRAFNSNRN
jgi:5-formyltetrahydrofolate cyclo-ligase